VQTAEPLQRASATAGAQYDPRHPEATALYRVLQAHLPAFLASWSDASEDRTLPRFVTDELRARRGEEVVIRFIIGQESGTRGYRDRQCTALMFPMLQVRGGRYGQKLS